MVNIIRILVAGIILFFSCQDSTSPDNKISILEYIPLKNNSEQVYSYLARTECDYVNYYGTAVWKISEQDPSKYKITEIRSGYKYELDELESPIGDTTSWGPDSTLIEITLSDDSLTFKRGNSFIRIPQNIQTIKDTIKIIDIYSVPYREDYDISGYVKDDAYQIYMEWLRDSGPHKMSFVSGENCRTSVNYTLLEE